MGKIEREALRASEKEMVGVKKEMGKMEMKVKHLEVKNEMLERINAERAGDLEEADDNNDQLFEIIRR